MDHPVPRWVGCGQKMWQSNDCLYNSRGRKARSSRSRAYHRSTGPSGPGCQAKYALPQIMGCVTCSAAAEKWGQNQKPETRNPNEAPSPKTRMGRQFVYFGFLVLVIHSDFGFRASGFTMGQAAEYVTHPFAGLLTFDPRKCIYFNVQFPKSHT